jgi:hypothetical protein
MVTGGAEPDAAWSPGALRRLVWPCRYTVPLLYGLHLHSNVYAAFTTWWQSR